MKRAIGCAILLCASASWPQSLGEIARANREQKKQRAAKVITNEDLKHENESGLATDVDLELDRMRVVFREVCADPRTEHGNRLSDADRKAIDDGVKPLRARVNAYERVQKQYKDELKALDEQMEMQMAKAWPKDRAFTEQDVERIKALRAEHEVRRLALISRGEGELKGYIELQKQLEAVATECPAAAKTVPD